jgi:hypothetical protein
VEAKFVVIASDSDGDKTGRTMHLNPTLQFRELVTTNAQL